MPTFAIAIILCQVWKLHPELLEMMSVDGLVKMVLSPFMITLSQISISDGGLTMVISPVGSLGVYVVNREWRKQGVDRKSAYLEIDTKGL